MIKTHVSGLTGLHSPGDRAAGPGGTTSGVPGRHHPNTLPYPLAKSGSLVVMTCPSAQTHFRQKPDAALLLTARGRRPPPRAAWSVESGRIRIRTTNQTRPATQPNLPFRLDLGTIRRSPCRGDIPEVRHGAAPIRRKALADHRRCRVRPRDHHSIRCRILPIRLRPDHRRKP